MRVALVHDFHSDDVPSGENEVMEAEVAALRGAGIDVRVAAVRNDDLATQRLHRAQAAATVATGIGISPLRLLDDFEPDVIHVHGLFPYLGRRWLRRVAAPVVTTAHNYRAVCANGYLFRDGQVCTLCADGRRWSGVRYGCYRSRLATVPLAWAGRRGGGEDPLLHAAARILVLSERSRTVLVGAGVPDAKLRRDWHFLPDRLDPGVGGGGHDGAWLVVGRLSPEKGIDRLVAEWPAAERLRIVGDGPLRPSLEHAAAGKDITFAGSLARADVLAEMGGAFGLVVPSLWFETFGLVYIEALAAGVPTLAFRPNVVADAIDQDGTGTLGSWGALDSSLAEARARFDALRSHCRQVFVARYAEKAFVARRLALYEELVR